MTIENLEYGGVQMLAVVSMNVKESENTSTLVVYKFAKLLELDDCFSRTHAQASKHDGGKPTAAHVSPDVHIIRKPLHTLPC